MIFHLTLLNLQYLHPPLANLPLFPHPLLIFFRVNPVLILKSQLHSAILHVTNTHLPILKIIFVQLDALLLVLVQPFLSLKEPKTLKTAFKFANWTKAMHEELDALKDNNTWTLVPRPINANVIGSKWVYRTKYRVDGDIDRLKLALLLKDTHKFLALTLARRLVLLLSPSPFVLSYHWLFILDGPFGNLMSKMLFFMDFSTKEFLWKTTRLCRP